MRGDDEKTLTEPLRAELRSLGYLENPLGRFFTGGLVGSRPALRTHLRVGCGVGVVLGVVSALLALPVVLTAPAPSRGWFAFGVVLFTFFAALAIGVVAAVAMFLAYRMTRRLVDRAALVARSSAVAVFVLSFLYFVSYWRRYGAALADGLALDSSLAVSLLGATLATGGAYFVARLIHLAAYAVLAAIPGYEFAPRRSGARRAFAAGVLLAAIAAFAAARSPVRGTPPQFAESGDAITPGSMLAPRVVLVAIDGLAFDDARDAIARGWMPNLARIDREGFVAPLAADSAAIPPAFWTTVATGLESHRHRIDSYYESRVLGLSQALTSDFTPPGVLDTVLALARVGGLTEAVPVTSATSRVMRIADVVAAGGLRAASVNYWATYPAPALAGPTVSERAYLVLRAEQAHGAAFDRAAIDGVAEERLREFLFADSTASQRVPAIAEAGLAGNFATIHPLLYDLFVEGVALDVLRHEQPHFLQIGLTGLDVLRYAYFRRDPATSDARLAARVEVLRGVYGALDSFLAELRLVAGPDALLVIATCPGISGAGASSSGFVAFEGPAVRATRSERVIGPEALAPTVLFALGLPGSEEQDASAEIEPFAARIEGATSGPPRRVRSYGLKPRVDIRDESSAEVLRFLAEFGYLSLR